VKPPARLVLLVVVLGLVLALLAVVLVPWAIAGAGEPLHLR
jgi:uncharacterized membrane protein